MRKVTITTIQKNESKPSRNNWKSKLRQFTAACTANLASVVYGFAMAWPTPSLPRLKSGELLDRYITEEEEAWLGSMVFMGAIISAPIFSWISQTYGRKIAGYSTIAPFLISWLLIMFSDSMYLLYAARFIMGASSGGVLVFCPMYVGEIAEDSIRGTLGTVRSGLGNLAFVFMYGVGPLISIRNMAIICFVTTIIFAVAFPWLPESPLYLMKIGKKEEAKKSLLWLRAGDVQVVEEELLKLSAVSERSENVSMKSIISSPGTRKALMICLILGAAQQLSGIYPILSYCVSIFELAGSTISPYTASIIIASTQLLGAILSSVFLDLAGRRILIIGSQIVMCLCLTALGTYFYMQQQGFDMASVGLLPVISLALYVLSLSVGLGSVVYVVMSEMFTPSARGLATTATTMTVWLMAFVATRFYPDIVYLLEIYGCYWLFAFVCITSAVYSIFTMPETKNRSLESILRELEGDSHKADDETSVNKNCSDGTSTINKY